MRCHVPLVLVLAAAWVLVGCAHRQTKEERKASPTEIEKTASTRRGPEAKVVTAQEVTKAGGDRSVYFDFDSPLLSDPALAKLRRLAKTLKSEPGLTVRIEGNCDELGTDAYNLALGEQRAQSAKRYLQRLGIDPSRIKTLSYGEMRPKYLGHDEASHSRNRRDDFVVPEGS